MPTITGAAANIVQPAAPVVLTISAASNDSTTLDTATWNAWNQIYTVTQRYTNTAATTANMHALQTELNALVNTWTVWNITYSAATTMTITSATTVGNLQVWDNWNGAYTVGATNREQQIVRDIQAGRRPSAEQQEKWRQEEIACKEAEAKRLREELAAKDKAIVLLKSCLTLQQIEEYEQKSCFHLHVGGKVYRIEKGSHGNVKLMDKDGKVKRSFCVQPRGVPEGDVLLAQKLLLETDEKRFYELANVTEFGAQGEHLRTLHAPRGADLLREIVQQSAG